MWDLYPSRVRNWFQKLSGEVIWKTHPDFTVDRLVFEVYPSKSAWTVAKIGKATTLTSNSPVAEMIFSQWYSTSYISSVIRYTLYSLLGAIYLPVIICPQGNFTKLARSSPSLLLTASLFQLQIYKKNNNHETRRFANVSTHLTKIFLMSLMHSPSLNHESNELVKGPKYDTLSLTPFAARELG